MNKDDIINSKNLHEELNEERRREGKSPLPAVNSKDGGNAYARKDKSFSSVFDFFGKLWKKH